MRKAVIGGTMILVISIPTIYAGGIENLTNLMGTDNSLASIDDENTVTIRSGSLYVQTEKGQDDMICIPVPKPKPKPEG